MPGKDSHKNKDNQLLANITPQQFLFKFAERNFEREAVDE
jgi:hypothetical protein